MNIPCVFERDVENIINSIPIEVDAEHVREFVLNGQERINEIVYEAVKYRPLEELIAEAQVSPSRNVLLPSLDDEER